MVVTYPPGGATDFQARIVTTMSSDEKFFGQPIVVINKPGAGGRVGWNWFAEKAANDGYWLSTYNAPHFIAQSLVFKDSKFTVDSFEPIATWGADPAVLIVPKDSPFKTLKDLIRLRQGQSRQGHGQRRRPLCRAPHRHAAAGQGRRHQADLRPRTGRHPGHAERHGRQGHGGIQQPGPTPSATAKTSGSSPLPICSATPSLKTYPTFMSRAWRSTTRA